MKTSTTNYYDYKLIATISETERNPSQYMSGPTPQYMNKTILLSKITPNIWVKLFPEYKLLKHELHEKNYSQWVKQLPLYKLPHISTKTTITEWNNSPKLGSPTLQPRQLRRPPDDHKLRPKSISPPRQRYSKRKNTPLTSPLCKNTIQNHPKRKPHQISISNYIFKYQRYETPYLRYK